ncbi:acyl transferase [Reichenbachiella sp. MSK19-1]|uniref:acyl transferase n=1 Tax=Reichenbachiella sp. MSK19-1 TaxID=1897631 RepID=UPI000E6BB1B2|nr:acyl transferase [Reichenbachiella sp. MSK19-1]RJE74216.1 acyl transferase [Reichenbachiella sp. MSK19-1]
MRLINSFKQEFLKRIAGDFEEFSLALFRAQGAENAVYAQYLKGIGRTVDSVKKVEEIPFMPIEFFKYHEVKMGQWNAEKYFHSSGTTGMRKSRHLIENLSFYEQNARRIFTAFYGDPSEYTVFALLPSYQEQGHSSLIAMVDYLMKESGSSAGGYYLNNYDQLVQDIVNAMNSSRKVILFGVGYALLDLCEACKEPLDGLTIIETGGMKGRREELTKEEFYNIMKDQLGEICIDSEYGMTELLSQAYSRGGSRYYPADSMRVMVRDINDPFSIVRTGGTGGLNIIDLANIHSCAFIETKDLGRCYADGSFEVLGRIDNSEIRGCNLLVV